MEEKIFPRPAVADELKNHFIEARLHTDRDGQPYEHNVELQLKFAKSRANPIFVIIDTKTGEPLRKKAGLMTEEAFLQLLRGPID
jgi:thioredoxin-related protein